MAYFEFTLKFSFCSDHLKNGEQLCIRVCFFLLLVFHAKSGTTNNYRNGSSDISYLSPFNRDSNGIKNCKHFFTVENNRFEIIDFWSISN